MAMRINPWEYPIEFARYVYGQEYGEGLWDDYQYITSDLLLITTSELYGAVQAQRNGRTSQIHNGIEDLPDREFVTQFEKHIKDTAEDKLTHASLLLFYIVGDYLANYNNRIRLSDFFRGGVSGTKFSFLVYKVISIITDYGLASYNRCGRGIWAIRKIAQIKNIDLLRHMDLRMRYNEILKATAKNEL